MSSYISKASGAEFVVTITESDGSYFAKCFLRAPSPAPGFLPSQTEVVFNNSDLPSFPRMSIQQARNTAIEQARSWGYQESEIIWED